MKYRLASITEYPGFINTLLLEPAQDECVNFVAGQYVELMCPDGSCLPYSIANAPRKDHSIELFVRQVLDDKQVCALIEQIKAEKWVDIQGPYGECVDHSKFQRPTLFLAAGTGIAQVNSLIQQLLRENNGVEWYCYWGVSAPVERFVREALSFQPEVIFSDENKKRAHHVVREKFSDLKGFQAYVSGSSPMVDVTVDCLLQLGIDREFIYSDRFAFP